MKLQNLKQKAEQSEVFSFRLPVHLKQNINQIAKHNNSTPQEVIRYSITNLVNDILND
mgnify:CR=1 FL=1|tara:strand:- start:33 stop:206 length:174 start_codon:yes stop_codon:yes gene_type:complete